jgi:RNA polymerase-interacting CarD/CdnL/TRCF family regulator
VHPKRNDKRQMPMLSTHGRTEGIKYYQASFIASHPRIAVPSKSHQIMCVGFDPIIRSRSLGDEVEVIRDDQSHHPGNTKSAKSSSQARSSTI